MNDQGFMSVSGRLKMAVLLTICAMLIVSSGLWIRQRISGRLLTPQEETAEQRPLLATVAAPERVRKSILANDFELVTKFQNLPEGCRAGFLSSFTAPKSGKLSGADIADPGQPFQFSDALIPGLPFRRLVFAGERPGECFIYFQHGGKMYPEWCLAVFDESSKKPMWIGMRIGSLPAQTVSQLRLQLLKGAFRDDAGLVC